MSIFDVVKKNTEALQRVSKDTDKVVMPKTSPRKASGLPETNKSSISKDIKDSENEVARLKRQHPDWFKKK